MPLGMTPKRCHHSARAAVMKPTYLDDVDGNITALERINTDSGVHRIQMLD